MSNRLGTKAETTVIACPFFSRGCGSKGGKAKSTLETVFQGLGSSKIKRSTGVGQI